MGYSNCFMDTKTKVISNFFRNNYYLIVPILITILIYSISLTYGFRNFDEDTLIKDFFVNKYLSEYLDKILLIYSNGVTQANGFAFSSIRNIHFSILGTPLHYFLCYLHALQGQTLISIELLISMYPNQLQFWSN